MKRPTKIVLIVVVAALVIGVAGPWVYITFVRDEAPEALSIDIAPSDSTASGSATGATDPSAVTDPTGDWVTNSESVVGYRVDEILLGQDTTAVGRTSAVTGTLTSAGTQVTRAEFEVDMTTIKSDSSRRDGQFDGRIMDVATYPTATFTLTSPIELPADAVSGRVFEAKASGELTLRGLMKPVEVTVQAQVSGETFTVVGAIEIVFADWGIPEPSIGPVSVEPRGLLEFSLVFERATAQG